VDDGDPVDGIGHRTTSQFFARGELLSADSEVRRPAVSKARPRGCIERRAVAHGAARRTAARGLLLG
jgi:hypothetical protein